MSSQGAMVPNAGNEIVVRIAGEPCAQGRPRAVKFGEHVRLLDPKKSRHWKAYAADLIGLERGGSDLDITFPEGPLHVEILAVFSCPKGDCRKTERTPRRRHAKAHGDCDNLAKGCMDAATAAGLWRDDAQVARLVVEKWIAAQDEAPFVELRVRALT